MKRASMHTPVKRTGDVRKDLTQSQLAWIGSVALAYNEAEVLLDIIIAITLGLHPMGPEVTNRINGVDGKIEIAKLAFSKLSASPEVILAVAETLGDGGFALFKKYRDRVIHARISHARAAIALAPAQRGKFEEILLTDDALRAVYDRLALIRLEMIEFIRISHELRNIEITHPSSLYALQRKAESESRIQGFLSQRRGHLKARLSLPPLPEFPSESELHAMDVREQQERQALAALLMAGASTTKPAE